VGCSRATDSQNLATAHSQASSALEIGRRMLPSQDVFTYQNLLPWELVSALEPAKLQQILTGISSGLLPLDPETLKTANAFLANNLSLANTARVLFIHRNTLVYRLEKLHRNTGFDLRQFNDAMIFKLIMLIAEYSGTGEGSRQCELVSI
jgi:carbohydrate diacid regulator